ncbi:MAG TPA: hypothetical protein VGM98_08945, partial [Schlesneria sp.]
MLFNEYVQCRWPIHAFHIDPVTQDQNVGDRFTSSRELQTAMAVAVSTGRLGIDQAAKFARRLELDIDTVAINRTVVGFSHGDDTFGWRFFPRVQTPPTEGNLTVAFRDLLAGGPRRDVMLRQRQIEPGARECVALMVAPAFLRQVILDVNGDWQVLTNTRRGKPSTTTGVQMGREVQRIRELSQLCVRDAGLNRDGEVHRLLQRARQLEHALPLQTIRTEVPVSNDMGGFRVLVPSGNFTKAPQLYGWTGRPGYVRANIGSKPVGASFFLMGANFKLQGTRVIAGTKVLTPNQTDNPISGTPVPIAPVPAPSIPSTTTTSTTTAATVTPVSAVSPPPLETEPAVRLISDSVMEVRLPYDCQTFNRLSPDGRPAKYVSVHVATYFGTSQEMHIPIFESSTPQGVAASWKSVTNVAQVKYDSSGNVTEFTEAQTTAIKTAFQSPFHPGKGELRSDVFLITKGTDDKEVRKKVNVPPIVIGLSSITDEIPVLALVQKVRLLLQGASGIKQSDKVIAIEIEGSLKLDGDNQESIPLGAAARFDFREIPTAPKPAADDVIEFDWDPAKNVGHITYDAVGHVKAFSAEKGISVTGKNATPFHPQTAELRCVVSKVTMDKNGKETSAKLSSTTEGVIAKFEKDSAGVPDIATKILLLLQGEKNKPELTKSDGAIALEVEGYLKFNTDDLPIVKLKSKLRFDLQEVTMAATGGDKTKAPHTSGATSIPPAPLPAPAPAPVVAKSDLIEFDWKPTKVFGRIDFDDTGRVKAFSTEKEMSVSSKNMTPFHPQTGELRCYVITVAKDKQGKETTTRLPVSTEGVIAMFTSDSAPVADVV